MKEAKLNIKKMSVDELIEKKSTYNPRQMENEEKNGLDFSLGKYGYVQNIIYNERTGRVVSGHQRLDVLKDQGYDKVDVHVVDLSEEDEKKLNVLMNSNTITGDFTSDINKILEEISERDPEFFDMTNLSRLFVEDEFGEDKEEGPKNKDEVKGMANLPYESYDCILVICKRRDDFMYLSSKLNLGDKVVISSPIVKDKKTGYTRCVDAKQLIKSFEDEFVVGLDEENI